MAYPTGAAAYPAGPAAAWTGWLCGSSEEYRRHAWLQPSSERGKRSTGEPGALRSQMPKSLASYPSRYRWPV